MTSVVGTYSEITKWVVDRKNELHEAIGNDNIRADGDNQRHDRADEGLDVLNPRQ
jgi:hypothetical protein